jgi:hypothetical protein
MSFGRSLFVLLTIATPIGFPIFFGYGLAAGSLPAMAAGIGCLAAAAALFYLAFKRTPPAAHD